MLNHPLSNTELLEELNKHVYGHTAAKKAIINVINRSRIRWHQKYSHNKPEKELLDLHNLLLIGPSGTGKTHLVKTMATICDIPLLTFDATHLGPVGGKGDLNVQVMIKEIKAEVNSWAANSKGIFTYEEIMSQLVVFIDEIDKLGIELHSGSNWNKETQSSLLKLVAGDDPELGGITFIFAGAFTRVFEEVKNKNKSKKQEGIGFTFKSENNAIDDIDWDDKIVDAGIIHELAGRINQVVCLENLTIDHYYAIMNEHIVPHLIIELAAFNLATDPTHSLDWILVEFDISMDSIDQIVKKAFESGQGVRMLKKKLSVLFRDFEFNFDKDRHIPKLDLLIKEEDTRFNTEI